MDNRKEEKWGRESEVKGAIRDVKGQILALPNLASTLPTPNLGYLHRQGLR